MTMNGSMNGNAFEVFIQKCLLPKLWAGAVVVMDNVPSHKVAPIEPLIQSVVPVFSIFHRIPLILIRLNFGGRN